jgi:predicted outer membrane repeat protein
LGATNKKIMRAIILTVLLFLTIFNTYSQVYVKLDASGLNNGTSWENAYTDLSTALNITTSGEIWVAAGVYLPSTDLSGNVPSNSRLNTFRIKGNIAVYGGFTGTERALSERNREQAITVLSGDIGIKDRTNDNCIHVVSSDHLTSNTQSILDGITVTNSNSTDEYGGGIYVRSAGTFVLRNCIIENNFAYRGGGGLYLTGSAIIENNIFRNNQAFEGGAIYLENSDATLTDNEISNNKADNFPDVGSSSLTGGGIYIGSYASPTIKNNLIKNNSSKGKGGGVTITSNYHTVFESNIVTENTALNGGGVFLDSSPTYFFNNVFSKNSATENGGAIYTDYGIYPKFINNTIVLNTAGITGSGLFINEGSNAEFINCILFSNTSQGRTQATINVNGPGWQPKFKYCNIEGGVKGIGATYTFPTQNIIDTLPAFVNISEANFNISTSSRMIDAGTLDPDIFNYPWSGSNGEVITFPTTDIAGNPRIYNGIIDIGAFESQSKFVNMVVTEIDERIIFSIYPNPTDGIMKIGGNIPANSKVHIFSTQGILVYSTTIDNETINISLLASGFYYLEIDSHGKIYRDKILKY